MAKAARRRDMDRKPSTRKGKVRNPPKHAPRLTITDDTALQAFVVAKGSITDSRGVKCWKGEECWLAEEHAQFMANNGFIEVKISFDASARPIKELVTAEPTPEVADGSDGDTAEAVATPAADADGKKPRRRAGSSGADEAEGDNPRPRRRGDSSQDA